MEKEKTSKKIKDKIIVAFKIILLCIITVCIGYYIGNRARVKAAPKPVHVDVILNEDLDPIPDHTSDESNYQSNKLFKKNNDLLNNSNTEKYILPKRLTDDEYIPTNSQTESEIIKEKKDFYDNSRWRNEAKTVMEELEKYDCINLGKKIADIGGGTGYYSLLFSQAVGKYGTVYLVEIQPTCIYYALQTIRKNKFEANKNENTFSNIIPTLTCSDWTGLSNESVDTVFVCYMHTLHQGFPDFDKPVLWDKKKSLEIQDRLIAKIEKQQGKMLDEINRILKPGGKFVIIEDMEMQGMPYRLDRNGINKLFEKHNFKLFADIKSLCRKDPDTKKIHDIHFLIYKK